MLQVVRAAPVHKVDPARDRIALGFWAMSIVLPDGIRLDALKNARRVLFVLCVRSGLDPTRSNYLAAWPSIASIAVDTGLSKSTVQLALDRLKAAGYIRVELRDIPNRRVNCYVLNYSF